MILIAVMISLSANAQIQGKKFSANLEGIGKISLQFNDNEYELSNSPTVILVKGNYEIEENKITFTDSEGPIACQNSIKGEYEFSYKNGELKLTVIQDACTGRKNIGAATWKEVD